MTNERRATERVAMWEQHGQTILLAVITATLIGTASILFASNATQASMTTEIRTLTNQVAEMRGTLNAVQLQYISRAEYTTIVSRVQALEARSLAEKHR